MRDLNLIPANFETKSPKISNIKQWNKGKVYIHLRKTNKNKIIIFQTHGFWWPEPFMVAQSARRNPFWTRHPSITGLQTHTRTPPDWDKLDTPVYIMCMSCGMWEETRVPRESPCRHEDDLQTSHDSGPNLESIFLVNITMKKHWRKQSYSRTCFTAIETTSFQIKALLSITIFY